MHADDAAATSPREAARLAFKTEISDAISGIVDRDHFLQRLTRRVAEVTGNGRVAIYTRSSTGDLLLRSSTLPKSEKVPQRVSSATEQDAAAFDNKSKTPGEVLSVPINGASDSMGMLVIYYSG